MLHRQQSSSGESSPASSIGSCQYAHRCRHAARLQMQRIRAAWADGEGGAFADEFVKLNLALRVSEGGEWFCLCLSACPV